MQGATRKRCHYTYVVEPLYRGSRTLRLSTDRMPLCCAGSCKLPFTVHFAEDSHAHMCNIQVVLLVRDTSPPRRH